MLFYPGISSSVILSAQFLLVHLSDKVNSAFLLYSPDSSHAKIESQTCLLSCQTFLLDELQDSYPLLIVQWPPIWRFQAFHFSCMTFGFLVERKRFKSFLKLENAAKEWWSSNFTWFSTMETILMIAKAELEVIVLDKFPVNSNSDPLQLVKPQPHMEGISTFWMSKG